MVSEEREQMGGAVGLLMADVQKALMGMTKKQGLDLGAARE